MQRTSILLVFFIFIPIKFLLAQNYPFFTNSANNSYYDPSYLFATSPSTILTVNSNKFPVSVDTFYSQPNALKLQWKPITGGDWGAAIAAPGWPGRDVTFMDSVNLWVYAKENITSSALPKIYLEDLSNQKTAKINLSNYSGDLQAGIWTKIRIPIRVFIDNPGSADLTKIKVIYLGQSVSDGIQRTLFIDEVSISGNYNASLYKFVTVLGSSTAAGSGPSSPDSAWVIRYKKHLASLDSSFKVINLAVGGYTTYQIMPTGFTPPAGRPVPAINNNITFALTYNPIAVLINMPSNDAANNYAINEQIANYDTLVRILNNRGINFWITTTQPRNFTSQSQLDLLKAMRDSTFSRYGAYAVDFWNGIADANGWILPQYNSGDGVHLNNTAHRILFERMRDATLPQILPVELAMFNVRYESGKVKLYWVTTNEINNRGFEIERSINNQNWHTAGWVDGNGTTDGMHTYEFIDLPSVDGDYLYRLKQVDFNGQYKYSDIAHTIVVTGRDIYLGQNYPNPFNDKTNIYFIMPETASVTLKLFDVLGRELKVLFNGIAERGNHKIEFNASGLHAGIYYYTLTANGYSTARKMILTR